MNKILWKLAKRESQVEIANVSILKKLKVVFVISIYILFCFVYYIIGQKVHPSIAIMISAYCTLGIGCLILFLEMDSGYFYAPLHQSALFYLYQTSHLTKKQILTWLTSRWFTDRKWLLYSLFPLTFLFFPNVPLMSTILLQIFLLMILFIICSLWMGYLPQIRNNKNLRRLYKLISIVLLPLAILGILRSSLLKPFVMGFAEFSYTNLWEFLMVLLLSILYIVFFNPDQIIKLSNEQKDQTQTPQKQRNITINIQPHADGAYHYLLKKLIKDELNNKYSIFVYSLFFPVQQWIMWRDEIISMPSQESLAIAFIMMIFVNQIITSGLLLFFTNIVEMFDEYYCIFGGSMQTLWRKKFQFTISMSIIIHVLQTIYFVILSFFRQCTGKEMISFGLLWISTLCFSLMASSITLFYMYCCRNKEQRDRIMKIENGRFTIIFYPVKIAIFPTVVSFLVLLVGKYLDQVNVLTYCSTVGVILTAVVLWNIYLLGSNKYKLT